MTDAEREAQIRKEWDVKTEPTDWTVPFLLRLLDEARSAPHPIIAAIAAAVEENAPRIAELLAANNREVERREAAEAALHHMQVQYQDEQGINGAREERDAEVKRREAAEAALRTLLACADMVDHEEPGDSGCPEDQWRAAKAAAREVLANG